jgi:hypothetical protein
MRPGEPGGDGPPVAMVELPGGREARVRDVVTQYARLHDRLDLYGVARGTPRDPCTMDTDGDGNCGNRCRNCTTPVRSYDLVEYDLVERFEMLMDSLRALSTPKPRTRSTFMVGPNA